MFRKTTIKKSALMLVALLLCAVLVFAACKPSNAFKPVEFVSDQQVDGNGGIAVRYGDYIYYINGYQSSAGAKNNYSSEIRIGAVVRIKIADLESIIRLNTDDDDSSKITQKIKDAVSERAEMVIPNFYYSGNTTDTSLNGLYIFNNRIYITTPNNALDANGNLLSDQLVLTSYNLGGGDVQRHFVFESNAPQLKLSVVGDELFGTYVLNDALSTFKITNKMSTATQIAEKATSPKFTSEVDSDGKVSDYVYYSDDDGSICQFKVGDSEAKVLVKAEKVEHDHGDAVTYTLLAVNGARAYYSKSNDTSIYCATAEKSDTLVLGTKPTSYLGWGEKIVYTTSEIVEDATIYHIYCASGDGADKKDLVDPTQNGSSITLDRLEGNILHYTTDSISYKLDISNPSAKPVAYAYSLSTSATGWAIPDVLSFSWTHGEKTESVSYVFSVTSSGVTVVKFNAERKNNYIEGTKDKSSSTSITLQAK